MNKFILVFLVMLSGSAFAAKKKVSMWYKGCQASPWGGRQMPKPVTLVKSKAI